MLNSVSLSFAKSYSELVPPKAGAYMRLRSNSV